MTRKCVKCSEVILGKQLLCVDCGRKDRIGNKVRRCAFPMCRETFRGTGAQKYCLEHKGMTFRERAELVEEMRRQGLIRDH